MIFGGIVVVLVVYSDCRWNCGSLKYFIVIVGGIVVALSSL